MTRSNKKKKLKQKTFPTLWSSSAAVVDTLRSCTEQVHLHQTGPRRLVVFASLWQQNNNAIKKQNKINPTSKKDKMGIWFILWDTVSFHLKMKHNGLIFASLTAWEKWHVWAFRFFTSLCCCRWKQGKHHAASTFSLANSGMTGFLCQLQLWMTAFYLLPAN